MGVQRTYMSGMTLDLGPELLICIDQLSHVMQNMVNFNNIADERARTMTTPVVSNNGVLMTNEMEKKREYSKNLDNKATFTIF